VLEGRETASFAPEEREPGEFDRQDDYVLDLHTCLPYGPDYMGQ
jgi:hypothetical protein